MLFQQVKLLHFLFLLLYTCPVNAQVFITSSGHLSFKSDAPLELIQAASNELKGAIDLQQKSYAFTVLISSFQGFNSPLQREHFNENYMESHKFPTATFSGKIIEDIDLSTEGIYQVRAKGILNIHGVKQERIIRSILEIKDGKVLISAEFSVLLNDHEINIPRIVYQKIAEEINVSMHAELKQK